MIPYRQDPEHIAPANQAPRCEHVRMNGKRCGSPALRGQSYCYFHDHVKNPDGTYDVPFPEDATSLQYGVMMVIRMLICGHVELKRCWLLLHAMQIANGNLKAFAVERREREVLGTAEESATLELAARLKEGNVAPNTLAGILMKLLPANGSKEPLPAANIAEEFAMERKIPEQISPARGDKPRMERIGGVWAPPLP